MVQTDTGSWVESWIYYTFIQEFITQGGFFSLGDWSVPIYGLILLIISLLIIVPFFRLITKVLDKNFKKREVSPDIINGIHFMLRIIYLILLVSLIISLLNINSQYILIVSGILTTAIAFASMKSINNFVAGVWITITRPFMVGDYVDVANTEGIVIELSLNYVTIKDRNGNLTYIPNMNCLGSKIINYTLTRTFFQKQRQTLQTALESHLHNKKAVSLADSGTNHCLEESLEQLNQKLGEFEKIHACINEKNACNDKVYSRYYSPEKIVRYVFTLELPREPEKINKVVISICEKYEKIFQIRPIWSITSITAFLVYQFIIFTTDPEDIVGYYDDFVKDIYQSIY